MNPQLSLFARLLRKISYSQAGGTADGSELVALISASGRVIIGYTTVAALQNLGITAGTVTASRALVVDANKDLATLRHLTISGNLITGTTTLSEAELGVLDSASSANSGTGKAAILGTSGAITIPGIISPTGGIFPYSGAASAFAQYLAHTGGVKASATTDGTDATPSVTETYLSLLFVPVNSAVTGVSIFNGSATGSGNITAYLALASATLAAVANTASTAVAGTDAYQRIPFAGGPIAIKGPAAFFVATQYNNTSTRFNTHIFGDFPAGKLTATTYGTYPASFAAPTTFTTGLGPIASLY